MTPKEIQRMIDDAINDFKSKLRLSVSVSERVDWYSEGVKVDVSLYHYGELITDASDYILSKRQ